MYKKNFSKNKKFNSNLKPKKPNSDNSKNTYFKQKYDQVFGQGYFDKLMNLQKELFNNQFIRVNLSKREVNDVEDFLKKNRVKYSKTFLPTCFKIEKSFFNLSSSVESLGGDIYIQDLASQVPVNVIDFESLKKSNRKIKILDMAASPGSKTTQLCDLLEFNSIEYEMIALEPQEIRITRLINNLQKQNCKNVSIFCSKGEEFKSKEKFDLILVDAPCSGNLIGDRNWISKRNKSGIDSNSKLQKDILKNAFSMLSDNGQLVYSTCSLEVEENEENVNYCINKLNVKVLDIKLKIPFSTKPLEKGLNKYKFEKDVSKCLRFNPEFSKTEGFFVALMKK